MDVDKGNRENCGHQGTLVRIWAWSSWSSISTIAIASSNWLQRLSSFRRTLIRQKVSGPDTFHNLHIQDKTYILLKPSTILHTLWAWDNRTQALVRSFIHNLSLVNVNKYVMINNNYSFIIYKLGKNALIDAFFLLNTGRVIYIESFEGCVYILLTEGAWDIGVYSLNKTKMCQLIAYQVSHSAIFLLIFPKEIINQDWQDFYQRRPPLLVRAAREEIWKIHLIESDLHSDGKKTFQIWN